MATQNPENEEDLKELKSRMKLICEADPSQYISEFGLKRYLKAFRDVDSAFKAILKTNKWRKNFGVDSITGEDPIIVDYLKKNVAIISRHRDMQGRPVIYIPAKNHNANERNIDELTRYMIYTLEQACKRCHEDIIDNLCIVFDLKDFGLQCMDSQFIKNLIWLLSRHFPERMGICIVYQAPIIFSSLWPVIKGWLNEVTANKVVFVNTELDLCKYLHPEILPDNV